MMSFKHCCAKSGGALLTTAVLLAGSSGVSAARPYHAARAGCAAHALFLAAARKEHFNPHSRSYRTLGHGQSNYPGAYQVRCDDGWAVASISRPEVGITDGETLFRTRASRWQEVAVIEGAPAKCVLRAHDVPAPIAAKLAHGYPDNAYSCAGT
jgi:hypothetical protein